MKKKLIAAIAATAMMAAAVPSVGAIDQWSYSEDVSVYVNGDKIDNGQYKPLIVNDRTMVRLVPVFDALGFSHSDLDQYNSVTFIKTGTNETYRFVAEKNYAIGGTGYDEEAVMSGQDTTPYIYFDVPATLQYYDVFYVPIRAFCDIAGLDISWDDSARSAYITSQGNSSATSSLLTYEEAKAFAEAYVNNSDILLSGNTNPITRNGRSAYQFTLRSKSMIENGGSGVMGETVYVYADNGEVEGNTSENASSNSPVGNDTPSNQAESLTGTYTAYVDGEAMAGLEVNDAGNGTLTFTYSRRHTGGYTYTAGTAYAQPDGSYTAEGEYSGTHRGTGEYESTPITYVLAPLSNGNIRFDMYDKNTGEQHDAELEFIKQ